MKKDIEYIKGEPKIKLDSLENTVVHTPTLKDYDSLVIIYESAGGKWGETGDLPTTLNYWEDEKEYTCVNAEIRIDGGFMRSSLDFYRSIGKKIISFEDYLEIQGIQKNALEELYLWYEVNKPERKSKSVGK